MTVKNWPQGLRPRERLLDAGPQALSDAELLAILLRTGVHGSNVIDVATDALSHFGSLSTAATASVKEWSTRKGIGSTKAITILAALELGRRTWSQQQRDAPL